jgi:hypothetical protein
MGDLEKMLLSGGRKISVLRTGESMAEVVTGSWAVLSTERLAQRISLYVLLGSCIFGKGVTNHEAESSCPHGIHYRVGVFCRFCGPGAGEYRKPIVTWEHGRFRVGL